MRSIHDCSSSNGFQRINQFALVSYIPDPLGRFLDELRLNLVPDCKPHAHVTILPPRPLCGEAGKASVELQRLAKDFHPFTVRLGDIARFPGSGVIYIQLATGCRELEAMYSAMNSGSNLFCEPYPYAPHITLAQNFPAERDQALLEQAQTAWKRCAHDRSFRVEVLTFVQNTDVCQWIDLQEISLTPHPPVHPAARTSPAEPMHRF